MLICNEVFAVFMLYFVLMTSHRGAHISCFPNMHCWAISVSVAHIIS